MGSFDNLLEVQEIDTKLDQLRHRHENLPERQAVLDARQSQKQAEAAVEATFAELHEVQSAQKHAEDEAATVEEKAKEVDRTLYGGTIKAAKELEAYQADLAMLKQRQESFEEVALEQMELAEPLESQLGEQRDAATAAEGAVADAESGPLAVAVQLPLVDHLAQRR